MRYLNRIKNQFYTLINGKKYNIIMSLEEYESLNSKNNIKDKNYSLELVKVLLDKYYINLERLYKNNTGSIIVYLKNVLPNHYIKKEIDNTINFIDLLNILCDNNLLDKHEVIKLKKLESLIDYKLYFKNVNNNKYKYYYMQNKKSIDISKILHILELEHDKFILKFSNIDSKYRDEILVLMKSFIKDNIENNNYVTNRNIILNYKYLLNITDDYDIYRKIKLRNRPKYLDKINLNENFVKNILNDLPDNFSKLESSIFVYIMLCRNLTHDEEDVDKKYLTINHRDLNRLSTIDNDNNIVVCYEFIAIFAKFLDRLGINYEIIGSDKYGSGHCSLNILYKDLYLKFESTLGLFDCDLTKIKNNIKACGIKIIRSNPSSNLELEKAFDNVYDYLEKKYNEKYYQEYDLVKKYREFFNSYSMSQKKKVFFEEIQKCNLPPVDSIKYIKLLKKIIFGKNDNFQMELITNLTTNKSLTISYIFVFRKKDTKDLDSEYYIYTYPNNIEQSSKEEIVTNFSNNQYNYIEYTSKKIKHIKL